MRAGVMALLACVAISDVSHAQGVTAASVTIDLRGRTLTLHVSGDPAGEPVVVSSGDGGWVHLGPRAAEVLSRAGYFVVGVDSKQYLSAFTSGTATLRREDVPADYRRFIEFAGRRSAVRPILIGVSEGAGLSVLAAADPGVRATVRGVVGLGLPDINELGWRWQDAIIYLTKGVPDEPTFSVAAIVDQLAPVPLAAIHSSHDEFVPMAQIHTIMDRARVPKRLWVIQAKNHRFSGSEAEFDQRLLEAVTWITTIH